MKTAMGTMITLERSNWIKTVCENPLCIVGALHFWAQRPTKRPLIVQARDFKCPRCGQEPLWLEAGNPFRVAS